MRGIYGRSAVEVTKNKCGNANQSWLLRMIFNVVPILTFASLEMILEGRHFHISSLYVRKRFVYYSMHMAYVKAKLLFY